MFLRVFLILTIFLLSTNIYAQDIVIHSKKSDEAVQQLKELVSAIEAEALLKSFSDEEIKILTDASSSLNGKTFPVPDNFKTKAEEIVSNIREALNKEGRDIEQEEKAEKVDSLIKTKLAELKTALAAHTASSMKGITDGVQSLQKESDANNKTLNSLLNAEPRDVDKMVQGILNAWLKSNEEAIIKSTDKPIIDIKKTAEVNLTKEAEAKNPMPTGATLEAEATAEFPRVVKGQKIAITWFPRPNQPKTSKGKIMVVSKDYVVFDNRDKVLIRDIKDPKIKDGLNETKTKANRANYIKDKKAAVLKARSRYFVKNLQFTVDKIIADNEKKGFIIAEGEWQPAAKYVTAGISKRLKDWKKTKAGMLDKAILADNKLINDLNGQKDAYTAITKAVYEDASPNFSQDKDGILNSASVEDPNKGLDDELENILAADKAKKDAADAANAAKTANDRKVAADKAKEKARLEEEARLAEEASKSSSMVMIAIVLAVIGAAAFVFFNPKMRSKVLGGGKKKKMSDVVANLQAPGIPGADDLPPLPMPGSAAPPPGIPAGMSARDAGATQVTEKTQVDLDGGLSIERGGEVEEAPSAAPRKKISLNLGGSSTPLADAGTSESNADTNSGGLTPPGGGLTPPGGGLTPPGGGLTPPGGGLTPPGGGLTPPGGGLTPPGGGLTPPGGGTPKEEDPPDDEDKSNLILNPNLDGGAKLRLKK